MTEVENKCDKEKKYAGTSWSVCCWIDDSELNGASRLAGLLKWLWHSPDCLLAESLPRGQLSSCYFIESDVGSGGVPMIVQRTNVGMQKKRNQLVKYYK